MKFRLDPRAGQAIYLQLMQQIRHAVETGVLREGDILPGIRALAEELVVSHNTVAKAYSELEHEGVLELRHGSGAYISGRRTNRLAEKTRLAQQEVSELIERLLGRGFSSEEVRRMFESQLLLSSSVESKR